MLPPQSFEAEVIGFLFSLGPGIISVGILWVGKTDRDWHDWCHGNHLMS